MERKNPLERRIDGIDIDLDEEELDRQREAEMLYSEGYGLPYRSNNPEREDIRLIEIGACILNRILYCGDEGCRTIAF